MSSELTRDEVLQIAQLARLELTEAEVDLFTRQLASILAYAGEVSRIDTTGVSPTAHVLSAEPLWRDDTPAPSLTRDEILAEAPDANPEAGLYRVPKVL
jgi:aspartyl-tRNA(Asn)/glutamyl-tRNA(Gln) amidotransferase subunit C